MGEKVFDLGIPKRGAKSESMKTCLIHEKAIERMSDRLGAFSEKVRILACSEDGTLTDQTSGEVVTPDAFDIVYGSGEIFTAKFGKVFFNLLADGPGIDWFQSSAAGLDHPALAALCEKSGQYTTTHTQAEAMAEWVLWQALDWLKLGPVHRAQKADHKWRKLLQREIMGSNWLIVGFGSIGEAVGRRVKALGGHVTGLRRTPEASPSADRVLPMSDLDTLLPEADIVLLCLPLTDESSGLANAGFFSRMKSDALFMNVGRGGLVDEDALVEALEAGRPSYAALDVTVTEPLPDDHAFWDHEKISLTPHDSPVTAGTIARADATFLDNLERYLSGQPLRNLV
ncbi:MAG: hydroxyacid dehydrogenase [Ponticaulis sp.]|nr:hydroxyacid dehydrogenase [Ponticaulis sp.]